MQIQMFVSQSEPRELHWMGSGEPASVKWDEEKNSPLDRIFMALEKACQHNQIFLAFSKVLGVVFKEGGLVETIV